MRQAVKLETWLGRRENRLRHPSPWLPLLAVCPAREAAELGVWDAEGGERQAGAGGSGGSPRCTPSLCGQSEPGVGAAKTRKQGLY